MKPTFARRLANLGWDVLVFAQILVYWTLAVPILLALRWIDRRIGTRSFARLDRLTRALADP